MSYIWFSFVGIPPLSFFLSEYSVHKILPRGGANSISQFPLKTVLSERCLGRGVPTKTSCLHLYVLWVVHHLLFHLPQFLPPVCFVEISFIALPAVRCMRTHLCALASGMIILMNWMHPNILEGEGAVGPHVVKRRPVCLRIIDAGEILAQMHLLVDVCPQRIHYTCHFP